MHLCNNKQIPSQKNIFINIYYILNFLILLSCSKESSNLNNNEIDILSIQVDSVNFSSGISEVNNEPIFTFVFSKSINKSSFEKVIKINSSFSSSIESFNQINNSTFSDLISDLVTMLYIN